MNLLKLNQILAKSVWQPPISVSKIALYFQMPGVAEGISRNRFSSPRILKFILIIKGTLGFFRVPYGFQRVLSVPQRLLFGFLIWVPYLGSLFRFLILVSYSGSFFGFLIQVPFLGSLFWFLIWVPYLSSLFEFLIWVPYSCSLFGFLIWVPHFCSLFRFLIQVPSLGSFCSLFGSLWFIRVP